MLNESFVSDFGKLNESDVLIGDSDLQRHELTKNSIIKYEEVKARPATSQSRTHPKPFTTKLKAPTPVSRTPKRIPNKSSTPALEKKKIGFGSTMSRKVTAAPAKPKAAMPRPQSIKQGHIRSKSDLILESRVSGLKKRPLK